MPMQETREMSRVLSLRWKDPLEKVRAAHSSIPAWRILETEEPGGPQSMGTEVTWHARTHAYRKVKR